MLFTIIYADVGILAGHTLSTTSAQSRSAVDSLATFHFSRAEQFHWFRISTTTLNVVFNP